MQHNVYCVAFFLMDFKDYMMSNLSKTRLIFSMLLAMAFIANIPTDSYAQSRRRRANRNVANTEVPVENTSASEPVVPETVVQPDSVVQAEPVPEPEPDPEIVPEQPAQFSYVEEDSGKKPLTPGKKVSLKERITFTAIYSQIEMGGKYDEYWGERVQTLTSSGYPYEVEKSSAAYGIGLEYGITERFGIGTDLIYFGESKWIQNAEDTDYYAKDKVLSANLYLKFNLINWRLFKYLSIQAYGKAGGGYYVRSLDYKYYKPPVQGTVSGSSFGYSYGGGADLSFGKKGGFVLGAEYMFYKANDKIHVNRFSGQELPAFEAALVNFHAGIRFGGKPEVENEEAEF